MAVVVVVVVVVVVGGVVVDVFAKWQQEEHSLGSDVGFGSDFDSCCW